MAKVADTRPFTPGWVRRNPDHHAIVWSQHSVDIHGSVRKGSKTITTTKVNKRVPGPAACTRCAPRTTQALASCRTYRSTGSPNRSTTAASSSPLRHWSAPPPRSIGHACTRVRQHSMGCYPRPMRHRSCVTPSHTQVFMPGLTRRMPPCEVYSHELLHVIANGSLPPTPSVRSTPSAARSGSLK